MRIILKYSLVILLFIFFSSESYSQPRVLKCEGDCGALDESNKYSAVARLCYGSSSDPLGSDVTFIEDDIIITQAHIFGNPRKTAPCCGGDCEKKADDWKRYKNNMFVCDGTDYGKKGKIRIGKVIDVEFRMTETFGYDIAIAHIDRDCDQCNRDVKIDPIPLANSLPKLGADAVHVHVGDPRNRNTRRSSPHKLIWPVVGGNVLPGNGYCDVLDVVLDGPYYIDPDWFTAGRLDPEYNNGPIIDVVGDGSDFFKREVTVNGVRIMGAGDVGGQVAVPDAWLEKVGRMFELFTDPTGSGINSTYQRNLIKNLSGDTGTYHAGFPTIQRVARGAGADYSTNFLTDAGIIFWNLTNLFDTHVQNDMVWYLNSTGDGYGDGDIDAQEVIEHVFHTLHMHGLDAVSLKMYSYISADWNTGPLYNAMVEAYDAGKWDSSGYGGNAWKTDGDAFEVAAKEYLYLLNFCMFEYTDLWEGGSLSPEWSDDMRTQAGIQANNPLGYALHNTYIAPVISKPSLATIRSIFQDGNTPDQDDPSLAGASGYVVDPIRLETRWDGTEVPVESVARTWWIHV